MQYVVLIASKKDTSDRHWVTRKTLAEIKEVADCYPSIDWFTSIYQLDKEL